MSAPADVPNPRGWHALDPWDKAAQWITVAPEISKDIVTLARANAKQQMRIAKGKAEAELKAGEFRQQQDKLRAEHVQKMERRYWMTNLIATVGGLLSVAALIAVSLQYAASGNWSAGAAVFGLGSSLVGGIYGAQYITGRRMTRARASAAAQTDSAESAT